MKALRRFSYPLFVVLLLADLCTLEKNATIAQTVLPITKNIVYCRIHGKELHLDLHYPPIETSGVLPLIMFVHGGGWVQGDKQYVWGGPLLPSHGYIVASVNYRLAPDYKFPAMIIDVKCALRFLKANAVLYRIDPNRIGLIGSSAGAHLVSLMGVTNSQDDQRNGWLAGQWTNQNDRVQAVVDLFGLEDLAAFPSWSPELMKTFHVVFNVNSIYDPQLMAASPVSYISENTRTIPTFLIMHGDQDTIVPPTQSEEFYHRLSEAGVNVQLVMVANAGHNFVPVPDRAIIRPSAQEIEAQIVTFFDIYVKNDVTSAGFSRDIRRSGNN